MPSSTISLSRSSCKTAMYVDKRGKALAQPSMECNASLLVADVERIQIEQGILALIRPRRKAVAAHLLHEDRSDVPTLTPTPAMKGR